MLYFNQLKIPDKIQDIFVYMIANYEYNFRVQAIDTEKLLERVFVFINSMGVHSKYPYLYTNYGTGDIS